MPSSSYSPSPVLKRKHKSAIIDSPDPSPLRENTRRANLPSSSATSTPGDKDRMDRPDERGEKTGRPRSALGANGHGSGHGHGQLAEDGPRRPGQHLQPESSASGSGAAGGKRVVSALQMQQQKKGRPLNAVDAPEKLLITRDSKDYESWMQLSLNNVSPLSIAASPRGGARNGGGGADDARKSQLPTRGTLRSSTTLRTSLCSGTRRTSRSILQRRV